MTATIRYEHTQYGKLKYMLGAIACVFAASAVLVPHPAVTVVHGCVALLIFTAALCFGHLTVRDEDDCLAIRYGPLPVFRKLIPYSDISSAETGRSKFVDGWGIHWIPGRGWTYNLWGFNCVVLSVRGKTVRVGSDDVEALVAFLRARTA